MSLMNKMHKIMIKQRIKQKIFFKKEKVMDQLELIKYKQV